MVDKALNWHSMGYILLAKAAYERTKGAQTDRTYGESDAYVAIVFSALTLEAFINELAECATFPPWGHEPSAPLAGFASVMKEAEESHAQLELKYKLVKLLFTQKSYDESRPPYQDFKLLIDLRDALVHLKPMDKLLRDENGKLIHKPPALINRLRSKNILSEHASGVTADFAIRVSTGAVAKWACNTAVAMVRSVLKDLPEGWWDEWKMEEFKKSFTPIR